MHGCMQAWLLGRQAGLLRLSQCSPKDTAPLECSFLSQQSSNKTCHEVCRKYLTVCATVAHTAMTGPLHATALS